LFDENIANEYNEWEVSLDKIFARRRICDRQKNKIVVNTLTNDALVWWNNLHDYEKPQTWRDVKALMKQFVSMDDTKNNLSNSTDVLPSHKSELPLLQEDCLVVPCNKEDLCDDNTIISMPQLENKLDVVASDPINCAEIRSFNPITSVHDELKLFSLLNTLGYIEFDVLCNC
jgi:cell division protein FtsI/penicillin-binding protein 2